MKFSLVYESTNTADLVSHHFKHWVIVIERLNEHFDVSVGFGLLKHPQSKSTLL